MPMVNSPAMKLQLGRMDSDYHVTNIIFNVDNHDRIAGRTFDQLEDLCVAAPTITRPDYIRMWKTIVLARLHHIYEGEKKVRPQHYIRLASSIEIPRTLGDLLYAIGQFHSTVTGRVFDVVPPPHPQAPPDYYNVDANIVHQWSTFHARMRTDYLMTEMPKRFQFAGTPLMLAMPFEANNMVRVKAVTNEPQISDALLRLMHEANLLAPVMPFVDCHLTMTEAMYQPALVGQYVGSYVLGHQ